MMIPRLTIIGVGLIGGSLAQALKAKQLCQEVVGCGRQITNLQKAVELGVIDRFTTAPAEAVKEADMVVIAVPLGSMGAIFANIDQHLPENAIITDVGSSKGSVVADAQTYLPLHYSRFVPAHPIAGGEKSGVTAAIKDLFINRYIIITPTDNTQKDACQQVNAMWSSTGANVVEMSVEHHDEVLAATSHLPHVLAYNLVHTLATLEQKREIFRYSAGGFRDFTRIASSDPTMWRDICLANQPAILQMIDIFSQDLAKLRQAIADKDSKALMKIFADAKQARDNALNR